MTTSSDAARLGYDPEHFNAWLERTKLYSSAGTKQEEAVFQGGHAPKGKKANSKAYQPKPPNGMVDVHPDKMPLRNEVFGKIREVFRVHGAKELETPVCELKQTLTGKYGEDSKLVYDLQDQGGELLSLRYDLTVPFARYLAEHGVDRMRRFHIARVYRRDHAHVTKGRFREFYQCDFDAAGEYEDMVPDAECVKICSQILDALEFHKYNVTFEIKINHRALLDGVFALCGVTDDQFRIVCSSVDKLDKEEWAQVKEELHNVKNVSPEITEKLAKFVSDPNTARNIEAIEKICEEMGMNESCRKGIDSIRKMMEYCRLMNVPMDKVQFDFSMARGLDYYTGVIFEAILKKTDGAQEDVGSVAGGGRYDNLVGMFSKKGRKVPCVGISLGIERLITVLERLMSDAGQLTYSEIDVFVGAIDAGKFESLPHRMNVSAKLWDAGIRTEFVHKKKAGKPNDQFSNCEKNRIPIMIYFGETEWAEKTVKVRQYFFDRPKDEQGFAQREERDVHLDQLISTVQNMLLKKE